MKRIFKYFIFATAVSLTACSDDLKDFKAPEVPEEVSLSANFEFMVEEGTGKVTFVNKSVGAKKYFWDFGDKYVSTSEEVDPSHFYSESGEYTVSLRAFKLNDKNQTEDMEEIKQVVTVEVTNPKPVVSMRVDGNFDDWNDIPALEGVSYTGFTTVKVVTTTNNRMFVYMEGPKSDLTINNGQHKDGGAYIGLDMDNNRETGSKIEIPNGDENKEKYCNVNGLDAMQRAGSRYVWGNTVWNSLGWTTISSSIIVNQRKVDNNKDNITKFEWEINLSAAINAVSNNKAIIMDKYKDDTSLARGCNLEEIGVRIQYVNQHSDIGGKWYYEPKGSAPAEVGSNVNPTFPVKLNQYINVR